MQETAKYNMSKLIPDSCESVKRIWENLCKDIFISHDITNKIWSTIESKYGEAGRAYHTLEHIDNLFSVYESYKMRITDANAVKLAIIFHDIVYDPKSKLNEEKSAELFSLLLKDHLDANLIEKVNFYIIETIKHNPIDSTDQDLHYFIDFDMSILGSERKEYESYTRKIRKEYSHVDDEAFCSGRSGFLISTLKSENHIFSTPEFHMQMEQKARDNMAWEINILST
mmetsp:Transcript_11792/g.11430  ORF Transcript_11792/g.11430 Transcript_11792/m.11430 type:complete len:227 (+) Transcript_11792:71-751(+)